MKTLKSLKQSFSLLLREKVLHHYLIPYSRFGVPACILQYIEDKKTPLSVIDIGASRGTFTQSLQIVYGIKKGLLIEPQPILCDQLKQKFADPQFVIYECAIADSERTQKMEVLNWDYSSSLLEVKRDIDNVNSILNLEVNQTIDCKVRTLDNILQEIHWKETIDLLKIDIQGAELMALKGAEQTLKRTKMIFTEVSFRRLYENAPVFQEVYDYLHDQGFKLLTVSDGFRGADGDLLQADALFCQDL
ncbi:FkbM family methyltransferase [Pseudanabaena sp. FACHB-1277]|uniref:FkbM family methyltransferase n=1 Tax=Pseudanabaena cinerea FACHB-1277 TaxID=2949581 RepID=A0A926UT17_9CYAN|nr:FkbM family methyltransferase [Pseudanabaena cinerea]MBD2150278.1 FkbM family methyltransferase [Pseudanabaena cinerea FACHB-1277]